MQLSDINNYNVIHWLGGPKAIDLVAYAPISVKPKGGGGEGVGIGWGF